MLSEMRMPIQAWSFPDSGAQVCMINSKMVTGSCLEGSGLVAAVSLQIKDAGATSYLWTGHSILNTVFCCFSCI